MRASAPPASPLTSWCADPRALAHLCRRIGRSAVVLAPRDRGWRGIAPDFDTALAMAASGLPVHVVAERRYDRAPDVRALRRALASGATIYLPQAHQVLPRLMRLMVALRVALLGPRPAACSFLFAVEGTGRRGMGLHHDGDVDAFWLQIDGQRTVTIGPPVAPGTPEDLDDSRAGRGAAWRTLALTPGTLLYLPPRVPHEVVCPGRSLALSLTWGRASPAPALPEWDVVSGRVEAMPPASRTRLWTQVPVLVQRDGGRLSLRTPNGEVGVPVRLAPLARRLAVMGAFARPEFAGAPDALARLLERGILAPRDLPLRVLPDDPAALDGWRFA